MNHNSTFLWGAATSSHQIEGNNTKNDWWDWEAQGRVDGGVRSGLATDHWNRFREDLKYAAQLGLNSYRFSIEWSRIEPEEGKWDLSAIDRYAEIITSCETLGLMPMVTLHHFTSPLWFANDGGFASPRAPARFLAYVKKITETLGSRIPLWCTINEPMVLVIGSYLGKFMPPAIFDPAKASHACANLLRSHVVAYDWIHANSGARQGPWCSQPVQIGIAHNLIDFHPDRRWHPIEQLLCHLIWRFYNLSWLDAITGKSQHFGVPGLLPEAPEVPEARGRVTADFIGVNYYTKAYVQWKPRDASSLASKDMPIGFAFARRGEKASDLGWAIHPKGLGKILRLVARYKKPIYITENGVADKSDLHRASFISSHLREIAHAIQMGIDVRGYYHWSLLDNFEWIKGYWPRFGLYQVDYLSQRRQIRKSAEFYSNIIKAHASSGDGSPSPRYFA